MTLDEAITLVNSVVSDLSREANGDKKAFEKALQDKRETDSTFAEALFQYEKFHMICDESQRQ